jgi:hypothetical protein
VTANVRDFPADDLVPHGETAQHPDAFLAGRFDDDPVVVVDVVRQISIASRRPHMTVTELIDRLDASDLPMLSERMRSTL